MVVWAGMPGGECRECQVVVCQEAECQEAECQECQVEWDGNAGGGMPGANGYGWNARNARWDMGMGMPGGGDARMPMDMGGMPGAGMPGGGWAWDAGWRNAGMPGSMDMGGMPGMPGGMPGDMGMGGMPGMPGGKAWYACLVMDMGDAWRNEPGGMPGGDMGMGSQEAECRNARWRYGHGNAWRNAGGDGYG